MRWFRTACLCIGTLFCATEAKDASLVRKRANEAFPMLSDMLGDRLVFPKLTRQTGVGKGLLNCSPSLLRWNFIGFDNKHTEAACCSASHMYRVCGRNGTRTMLLLLCFCASSTALFNHKLASENGGLTKFIWVDDHCVCKPSVVGCIGHGSCSGPCSLRSVSNSHCGIWACCEAIESLYC